MNVVFFFFPVRSAYGRALKLQPDCGSLWGDLGFNCFQQAKAGLMECNLSSGVPFFGVRDIRPCHTIALPVKKNA